MHSASVPSRQAAPLRHQTGLCRGRLRRLYGNDLAYRSHRRNLWPGAQSGGQRVSYAGMFGAWNGRNDGGRDWEYSDATTSGPGAVGQGARIAVWVLYAGDCNVDVRVVAELGGAVDEGTGGCVPG
uniref:(northern house mosquito) hypothetical protein n=1 Tax=Culex pipiens TaxID=7175 RepID=A0A8D8G9P2_CULPI